MIINIKSAARANAVTSTDGGYQEKNDMQPGKAVADLKESRRIRWPFPSRWG